MVDGQTATFYVITKITSDTPDDIVLVAYQHGFHGNGQSNPTFQGAGTTKVGTGSLDGISLSIGYGDDPTKAETVGIIDGQHTPKQMRDAGKYRIPPRTWSQFWVKKDGKLGEGKSLFVYTMKASGTTYDQVGHVQFLNPAGDAATSRLDLKEENFATGGMIYRGKIRGRSKGFDGSGDVYQTSVGFGSKLWVAIYNTTAENAKPGAETNWFSVAAIPTKVTLQVHKQQADFHPVDTRDYWIYPFGSSWEVIATSDSGYRVDLAKVRFGESIKNFLPQGNEADRKKNVFIRLID